MENVLVYGKLGLIYRRVILIRVKYVAKHCTVRQYMATIKESSACDDIEVEIRTLVKCLWTDQRLWRIRIASPTEPLVSHWTWSPANSATPQWAPENVETGAPHAYNAWQENVVVTRPSMHMECLAKTCYSGRTLCIWNAWRKRTIATGLYAYGMLG